MSEVAIPPFRKLQKTMSEPPQLRRSSSCAVGNRINEAIAIPNYLRASIGSCHDFCKFGIKPDFQTIARTPMVKGSAAPLPKKSIGPAKDDLALLKRRTSSSTSRTPSSTLGSSTGQIQKHEIQLTTTRKAIKPKLPEELKPKHLRSKESSVSAPEILRQRNTEISTLKGASNSTGQTSALIGKGARNPKTTKETSLLTKTISPSPKRDATSVPRKVPLVKGNKNISLASTRLQTPKLDVKITPKKVSSVKCLNSHNKATMEKSIGEEEVSEKIIYVDVETNAQNSKDLSSEEKEQEKQDPSAVLLPEIEVSKSPKKRSISDNRKASAGKDHQSPSPRNLKFKKGKGVETEREKTSAGIRLKFRQAKLLALENQRKVAEAKRKNGSRKQETEVEMITTTNEVNEVVLRAQNPTEKEHAESLYNNVIKATARKLVGTKKSRVKALVGAFETIISLQDEKSQGKTKA